MRGSGRLSLEEGSGLQLERGPARKPRCSVSASLLSPTSPVLHENQLTHTDLKPENILFVNSEFETLYNEHKVLVGERVRPSPGVGYPLGQTPDLADLHFRAVRKSQ